MFSATFDSDLEKWFQMNLDNGVTLIVGQKNLATDTVKQTLQFVGTRDVCYTPLNNSCYS